MQYVSGEEILALHSEIIDETGGLHGIRDVGLFQSIILKPQTTFGGNELYKDVFTKAAVYLESFVQYHVFVDGNKRTGLATAVRFLSINGYGFHASNKEVERYIVRVAVRKLSISNIAQWLKKHSRKEKL